MAEEIQTLALRLQGAQYTRDMRKARLETNAMSRETRSYARWLRDGKRNQDRFKKSTNQMSAALGKAALALGGLVAARGLARFGKESVQAAAEAEETANKFSTVFSSVGATAEQAAQQYAQAFDVADSTAKRLLGTTGDLLVGFGFSEDAALDLSEQVNTLAADLASFTNIEGGTARASEALTKALVGETEQAKALGIVIRQGTKEYKERVAGIMRAQNVTILQAKALANLQIAAEQSKKALGDYSRTSESTSNLIKANAEAGKELKEAFGGVIKAILPIDGIVKATTNSMQGLAGQLKDVKNFLTDIESLDRNSALALLLPDLDARDAGNAALRESQRIMKERRAARAEDAKLQEMLEKARARAKEVGARTDVGDRIRGTKAEGRELMRRIDIAKRWNGIVKGMERDDARIAKDREDRRKKMIKQRAAERRRTEPLRDLKRQLMLQELVNKGREKEAFIQEKIWSMTRGRVLTEKELATVRKNAGKLYDAMNRKEKPVEMQRTSRSLRLAGAALEGSAEAARTIIGAGSTVEEEIERNTKASAKNSEDMKKSLRRIAANKSKPANFRRGR